MVRSDWTGPHLLGHVRVLLLLLGLQHRPPVRQDLGGSAVVQAGVLLSYQRAVALTEEQEGVHGPARPLLRGVLLRLLPGPPALLRAGPRGLAARRLGLETTAQPVRDSYRRPQASGSARDVKLLVSG